VIGVWSFWTKPLVEASRRWWLTETHHLYSWVLSLETARPHFEATSLVADALAVELLVDGLGLRFDQVSTSLDALDGCDPGWWALGKLYAYRAQTRPFLHIDSDVYLWKPLAEHVRAAGVIAQSPERVGEGSWYRPELFDERIAVVDGWLPEEWRWYGQQPDPRALCCGVFGGQRVDFIQHYADAAIRLVEDERNRPAWHDFSDRITHNILFEQYFLSACLDFHQRAPERRFHDVEAGFVFDSFDAPWNEDAAVAAGYTHLIAGAKSDGELMQRLETRVHRDHPELARRCVEVGKQLDAIIAARK
jgi:hypothetical protein